ncbi:MAG: fibronectin type III domain-containing protein, partial [Chitinophagaceae bacterium]|nr:fibronectin type III domain-containing protein [Chitinophagaceae bacterium]
SVQGASSYNLRYKTVASNSWTYINNIAATSQMLNGLSPSTTYEFQVYPNCGAGISTFSYSKQWTTTSNCQGTYDKNTNNTITGSGIIPLNIDVFGMIHTASDLDYYQFSVSNLNPVMISLTNLPANYNISLLDSNYAIKGNSSSWGNNSEYITFVPPAIGKYYVKVFGVNNVFNSTACYTLKILDNTIPCTAPALSSLSMSVLGNTYGTCIWNSVPGALYYNLRYRAVIGSNPWITVSNIYGNMTALNGLSANTLYEFQVEAICTSGTSGFSPAKNFTTTSTCQGSYDNTSNNLSAGAAIVPSNTDIFGRIQTSTDVDFYKFVATTTDPLNIILSNLPANYNLYLYNASNTLLSSSLNNSTAIEVINFTPTSIGDYFIKVEGVSGAFNASQCYSLNINNSNLNCGMPAGLTLSVWGNTYATCLWNIVPGAISYNLRYKAVNSANWNTINNIAINSQSLSGLSASTNYEFQVQANCSSASSLFSSSKLFSTSATCQGTYDNASNGSSTGASTIPFNTQIFGRIESAADIDNYKFTTLTPGTLHISLKSLPANYDLIIYNASLAQIASSNNIGTADELIALSNVTPGLYYAKIVGQGGAFNTSQCYTFKVSTTGAYLKENDPLDQQELEEETFTVYPNPTTGMITLAYTLQTDDHVDIVMYDLTGRKIQSLQNQDQQKGEYKIQFDMKSLNQASGVYLIRLKTNSQDVKRKLMYENR